MSFSGLPPVPKSLLSFQNTQAKGSLNKMVRTVPRTPPREPPPPPPPNGFNLNRKSSSTLEAKLLILKKEMTTLRQVDMQLMNQLWSLQQSIQDVKAIINQPADLSPQSAIDPWELNHQNDNDYYNYVQQRLGSVRESDAMSSSTSSISSASGDKP